MPLNECARNAALILVLLCSLSSGLGFVHTPREYLSYSPTFTPKFFSKNVMAPYSNLQSAGFPYAGYHGYPSFVNPYGGYYGYPSFVKSSETYFYPSESYSSFSSSQRYNTQLNKHSNKKHVKTGFNNNVFIDGPDFHDSPIYINDGFLTQTGGPLLLHGPPNPYYPQGSLHYMPIPKRFPRRNYLQKKIKLIPVPIHKKLPLIPYYPNLSHAYGSSSSSVSANPNVQGQAFFKKKAFPHSFSSSSYGTKARVGQDNSGQHIATHVSGLGLGDKSGFENTQQYGDQQGFLNLQGFQIQLDMDDDSDSTSHFSSNPIGFHYGGY